MPNTKRRAELARTLNKAAKTYKSFLERQENDLFYTKEQKRQQKRTFLENHVSLFDEYVSFFAPDAGLVDLSVDGFTFAAAVGFEFPDSRIGRRYYGNARKRRSPRIQPVKEAAPAKEEVPAKEEAPAKKELSFQEPKGMQEKDEDEISVKSAPAMKQNLPGEPGDELKENDSEKSSRIEGLDAIAEADELTGEIDLQGRVLANDRSRTEQKVLSDRTVREKQKQETEQEKALKRNLSDEQIAGIRSVCVWMYNHTKKHQKFVENIAGRSPREKLLMFYMIEKDRRANLTAVDIVRSQIYVPDAEKFGEKLKFHKHVYKLWAKNVNWDLLADIAAKAHSLRGELVDFGAEKKEEKIDNDISFLFGSGGKEGGMAENDEDESSIGGMKENSDDDPAESLIIKQVENRLSEISEISNRTMDLVRKGTDKKNKEKINGLLDTLDNKIDELNTIVSENAEAEEVMLKAAPEGGWKKAKKKFKESAKANKYLGLIRGICGAESLTLKSIKESKGDFWGNEFWTKVGDKAGGLALDTPMAILNILSAIEQFSSLLSTYHSNDWMEVFSKGGAFLKTVGDIGKAGLNITTLGASTFAGASWGAAGKTAMAKTLKNTGKIGGIVLGGMTVGLGLFNMTKAGVRKSRNTDALKDLDSPVENLSPEEKSKRDGTHDIVKNIAEANRRAQNRTQMTGALQVIQGGLKIASGALGMATVPSLGLTGIAALVLTGLDLLIGIGNMIFASKRKKVEEKAVIDRYIGIDGIYTDYLKKNAGGLSRRRRDEWVKNRGGEQAIRTEIRREVTNILGFASEHMLFENIMKKYAQALYDATFMKNGSVITPAGVKEERKKGILKDRLKYAKLITSLGFAVTFPKSGGKPVPSAAEIEGRLKA